MKRHNNDSRARIAILAVSAVLCGGAAFGQGPDGGPWGGNQGGGPGGNRRPPPTPPVIQALDTNHDGIVDASEIANASASLKTLLKSGSNDLSIPDLLGPPRHGRRPQGQGNGGGPDMQLANPSAQTTGSGSQQGPPPGGPGGNDDGPPGPPPGGPGGHHPPGKLFQALDTNHDGILEADEIANASESLKKLEDANGEITEKELRPPPPPAPNGGPQQSGTNGGTGAPPPPPPPPE